MNGPTPAASEALSRYRDRAGQDPEAEVARLWAARERLLARGRRGLDPALWSVETQLLLAVRRAEGVHRGDG